VSLLSLLLRPLLLTTQLVSVKPRLVLLYTTLFYGRLPVIYLQPLLETFALVPSQPLPFAIRSSAEQLFLMVDSCTVDMGGGSQDSATARQLADAINGYPNATM